MQDTILNGSGTSRSMKIPASKAVVYQDVSAMVQDMVDGNFLFDIGPIRLEGVTQKGTDLNKANLLKDTTAALYGLGDSASPDDIFAAIRPLITAVDNKIKIATGSFSGTGSNISTKTITVGFPPKMFFLVEGRNVDAGVIAVGANGHVSHLRGRSGPYMESCGYFSGDSVVLTESVTDAYNQSGAFYYWAAIG